ncbi:MAG: FIST C-terminal domain-containing protein [Acidobacteria bacterium]|nr:FIST C-terminal domain-containing protein [Acidobacteriota bacterium]
MTDSTVVYTDLCDSSEAGNFLGAKIREDFDGRSPDALIVFASSRHEYSELLHAIKAACRPKVMVGCSSAGEFTCDAQGESSASAVALRSSEMQFTAGIGRHLRVDREAAAKEIVSSFNGLGNHRYLFRSALVLTDALAGYADDLIESLNLLTAGTYMLFGGGAGDDAQFTRTHVFYDTEAYPDAAIALEILSNKPLGIGVSHGWVPASAPMRVTEADGMRLVSLNAAPAVEALQEHAASTGQTFDLNDPVPFFLHNVIGIDTEGGHKLRVPLAVNADGSLTCAADIPAGATVHIMSATGVSSAEAAESATLAALGQLNGHQPKVALFFDCVATRLRMGKEFGLEMDAVKKVLGTTKYAGCNTYGQIARAERQFSGFHNCTAVVCLIPE